MRFYLIALMFAMFFSCKSESNVNKIVKNQTPPKTSMSVPTYGFEIVNTFKHDPRAFTQGLIFHDGVLIESTGQLGESSLRKIDLETGKILQKFNLASDVFAEGITLLNGKIYQLSWQNGVAWSYNPEDFKLIKEFRYSGEGWGLTNDGTNLIMSDGTHVLRVVNPENFETIRTIPVFRENGEVLMKINELEWVSGEIWANIWHSETIGLPNHIARISPTDGKLLGWINLEGISPEDVGRSDENTLNGIAYDEKTDRIFVTGKLWKRLFEIRLKSKP